MFFESKAIRLSTIFLIILTTLLVMIKPSLFFSSQGDLKSQGFTYNERVTPVTMGMCLYGALIPLYLLVVFTSEDS